MPQNINNLILKEVLKQHLDQLTAILNDAEQDFKICSQLYAELGNLKQTQRFSYYAKQLNQILKFTIQEVHHDIR